MASILEIARTDLCRYFEFFYSAIDSNGVHQFVGVRAVFGFGPDSFNRFRAMVACPDGPFVQLATDTSNSRATRRPRDVARNYPSYGWGCATMREMGFMADSKIAAPKGQLFLTLLPFPPNRGMNNAWEQVYLDARRNPGRDTLHFSAKNKCTLPEGKGSDRLIVFAVDLHMYASGINPVSYHPAGCYALKDNSISLSCMPIAYNMDTGTIMFSTAFKYMGGPKYGTGPGRGEEKVPLADCACPTCGADFPAGLHMCHSVRQADSLP